MLCQNGPFLRFNEYTSPIVVDYRKHTICNDILSLLGDKTTKKNSHTTRHMKNTSQQWAAASNTFQRIEEQAL